MDVHRIVAIFSDIPEPRVERTRRHALVDILVVSILAVICGAEGWDEIVMYGRARRKWLRTFLDLAEDIPSADTIRRVFEAIDPQAFGRCFMALTKELAGNVEDKVIAIDGKTVRRSFSPAKGTGPLHLVSAWCAEQGITLGQVATADKSNEITAIPELLELIDVRGATVTLDAMGCQKAIAAAIVDKKANYILAVKDNHPTLREDVEGAFIELGRDAFEPLHSSEHVDAGVGHGRSERRRVRVSNSEAIARRHATTWWSRAA